jgi:hypothetical protein
MASHAGFQRSQPVMSVTRTFTVDKPADAVVSYLADFGNAVDWDPGTQSCVRQDTGPIRDAPQNSSEITYHAQIELHGLARLGGPIVKAAMERL